MVVRLNLAVRDRVFGLLDHLNHECEGVLVGESVSR